MGGSNFKKFIFFTVAVTATFGISLAFQYAVAVWTAPAANPPTCNSGDPGCDAPLNVSNTAQQKAGTLVLNTAGNATALFIPYGKVGIGDPSSSPINLLQLTQDGTLGGFIRFKDTQTGGKNFYVNNGWAGAGKAGFYFENKQVMTFDQSSGNVGIGTTSPEAKLEVVGASGIRIAEQSSDSTPYYAAFKYDSAGTGFVSIQASDGGGGYGRVSLQPSGGNVGIGTAGPGAALEVNATPSLADSLGQIRVRASTNAVRALNLGFLQADGGGFLQISKASTDTAYYSLFLQPNGGNVGIGTTDTGARLEVAGQVKITGGEPGAGKVLTSDANGLASWQASGVSSQWTTSGSNIYYDLGNVGIGMTPDGYKLDVSGSERVSGGIDVTGGTGRVGLQAGSATAAGYVQWFRPDGITRIGYLGWSDGGVNNLGLNLENSASFNINGGSVGIGTTEPGYKLDVQGGQINSSSGLCVSGDCWTKDTNGTSGLVYGTNGGRLAIGMYNVGDAKFSVREDTGIPNIQSQTLSDTINPVIEWLRGRHNNTSVQNGDVVGTADWRASFGSGSSVIAKIAAQVDGDLNSFKIPGKLLFYTADNVTEGTQLRMTIDNSGKVAITNLTGKGSRCVYVTDTGVLSAKTEDCGTGTGGDNLGNHTATENIKLGSHWLSGDEGDEGIKVDASGNVGIGMTPDGYKLDVSGSERISGGIDVTGGTGRVGLQPGSDTAAGYVQWFRPDGTTRIGYLGWSDGGVNNLGLNLENSASFNINGGKVGIGTTNPGAKLDVAGSDAIIVPRGTTLERPAAPVNGMMRYNNNISSFEVYQASSWKKIFTTADSGAGGGVCNVTETYDTPGTYTYIVPDSFSSITIRLWGGGGGGGNSIGASSWYDGYGGGGGGAFVEKSFTSATLAPGTALSDVVVGAGGAAKSNGGDSSISFLSLSAKGGYGTSDNNGGNGGVAFGGTINQNGVKGNGGGSNHGGNGGSAGGAAYGGGAGGAGGVYGNGQNGYAIGGGGGGSSGRGYYSGRGAVGTIQFICTATTGGGSGSGIWAQNGSSVYYNGGSVGIGVADPVRKFHLADTSKTTDSNDSNALITSTDAPDADIGGSLGLGGRYDSSNNPIAFATVYGRKENAISNNVSGYLAFATRDSEAAPYNFERMRITSSGNVGISTTNPQGDLVVAQGNASYIQGGLNVGTLWNGSIFNFRQLSNNSENIIYGAANSGSSFGNLLKLERCSNGATPDCATQFTVSNVGHVSIGDIAPLANTVFYLSKTLSAQSGAAYAVRVNARLSVAADNDSLYGMNLSGLGFSNAGTYIGASVYGLRVTGSTWSGGSVANAYAIYTDAPTMGSVGNWAIYSASGQNYFGGSVTLNSLAGTGNRCVYVTDAGVLSAKDTDCGSGGGSDADAIIGNEVTDVANATLTRSGAGTAADPYKLALNLGTANTWTSTQTFSNSNGLVVSGTGTGLSFTQTTNDLAFVDSKKGIQLRLDTDDTTDNINDASNFIIMNGANSAVWSMDETGTLNTGIIPWGRITGFTGDADASDDLTSLSGTAPISISGSGNSRTVALAGTDCTNGQVLKWSGSAWACADDNNTGATGGFRTKRVFVTSTSYTGNLGGLAGADAKCQARAVAGGLTGTWQALLSYGTTGAKTRLGTDWDLLVDIFGMPIATKISVFSPSSGITRLNFPLYTTELGTYKSTGTGVWTGTDNNGNPTIYTCSNWTSSLSYRYGTTGRVGDADQRWINNQSNTGCNLNYLLYCFEQ